jgi:hypothetical protein
MVRSLHESIANLREFRFAPRAAICSGHLAANLSANPQERSEIYGVYKKKNRYRTFQPSPNKIFT